MAGKFKDSGPPLTDAELDAVATRLGLTLPESLRAQYKTGDGGRPKKRFFLDSEGNDYEVQSFRRMQHKLEGSPLIETSYDMLVKKKRLMAEHFLPFASDSGGDLYCIDTKTGAIWFWAADDYEPGDLQSALTQIAPTLEAFVAGMVTQKEAIG